MMKIAPDLSKRFRKIARDDASYQYIIILLQPINCDPEKVYRALESIRRKARSEERKNRLLDERRELYEDAARIQRRLIKELKAAQAFIKKYEKSLRFPGFQEKVQDLLSCKFLQDPAPVGIIHVPDSTAMANIPWDIEVFALAGAPWMKTPVSSHLRRRHEGRPGRAWLPEAHRQLSAVGVTEAETRKTLLQCVGLLPCSTE